MPFTCCTLTVRPSLTRQLLVVPVHYKDNLWRRCREALQALVSPTDAQLALCSAGAYGQKEGEGPQRDVLPAQLELEMLSKRWNVPTGCACCRAPHNAT